MTPKDYKGSRSFLFVYGREQGGNPEPGTMVSAQPPALSPRPPVLDDLPLGSGKLDFRETVDQRRFAELAIFVRRTTQ